MPLGRYPWILFLCFVFFYFDTFSNPGEKSPQLPANPAVFFKYNKLACGDFSKNDCFLLDNEEKIQTLPNKIQPMNRGKLFVIFDGKHCIVTIVWLHPQEFFDRATVLPLPYVTAGDDVLEYLRDSIREYLAQSYELRVLMPENELATIREKIPNGAEKVFHEYFVLQEEKSHRALRQQFTYGAIPLAYGCLFMILCMVFRQFFFGFPEDSFFNAVREGLLVIGWVAL